MNKALSQPAAIDDLLHRALFGNQKQRISARHRIRSLASETGIYLASIAPVYTARAKGKWSGVTVPAMNVRGLAYDFCRAILSTAMTTQTGLFIIEIARSEMGYTDQRPDELAVVALAAALREGYRGPLFLQGDHYKVKRGARSEEDTDVHEIERLIDESIDAGFYNIDIDASTTVDLDQPTAVLQQARNAEITSRLAAYIRRREPLPISIGGEIGEIGGRVSTVEDLHGFMNGFRERYTGDHGLAKVAVQTGTSHGGIPNPDGSIRAVEVDWSALQVLARVSRETYGLAGAVQHGASTLNPDVFGNFPDNGCVEIHLSTGFQNIIMNHPAWPAELMQAMIEYVSQHHAAERKPGQTDAQFFYSTRKHAWGPFKRQAFELPESVRSKIRAALAQKIESLFSALRVTGTRALVELHGVYYDHG